MQTELILNPDGSIYHLNLLPEDLAPNIFLVGDPNRVPKVAAHFDSIEVEKKKREFYTITGYKNGIHMSVVGTGIGTDNIDIVVNELDAIVNIDLKTGKPKEKLTSLKMLRLGTCGGMQADLSPGSLVSSRYAIGSDSLMLFYDVGDETSVMDADFRTFQKGKIPAHLPFYTADGDAKLEQLLQNKFPDIHQGITFTAGGFYGPQGRDIGRLKALLKNLPEIVADFEYDGYKVLNMEMETAAILEMCRLQGHQAGSICGVLGNRRTGEFIADYKDLVEELVKTGVDVMEQWARK